MLGSIRPIRDSAASAGAFTNQVLRTTARREDGGRWYPVLDRLRVVGCESVQLRRRTVAGAWADLGPRLYADAFGAVEVCGLNPQMPNFTPNWPGVGETLGMSTVGGANQTADWTTSEVPG